MCSASNRDRPHEIDETRISAVEQLPTLGALFWFRIAAMTPLPSSAWNSTAACRACYRPLRSGSFSNVAPCMLPRFEECTVMVISNIARISVYEFLTVHDFGI